MQRRELLQQASLWALLASPAARAAAAASTPTTPTTEAHSAYEWRSVPYGAGGYIDGFVFHPRERGLLYARTDIGGAYRFEPASQTWVPLLDHLSRADGDLMGVLSLAVDPADADKLYLACGLYLGDWARNAALLASSDRGATWRVTELGIKLGGNADGRGSGERLQVDPNHGQILLLGTSRDGLMKSSDQGRSFSRLDFAPRHVSLVLHDARSGAPGQATRTLYVGSHDQPGLYVSHNAGVSFAREPGTPAQVPQRAVFGPDGSLYVSFANSPAGTTGNPSFADSGSVWKRNPTGRWSDITPVRPAPGERGFGFSGLDVDRQVPGRLVVSTIERWTSGDELFVSTDDGAHWTALGAQSRHDAGPYPWLQNYLRGKDSMGHWMSDLKLDPFNGERAVYGTGYGLWMTDQLGAAQRGGTVDWRFSVANLEETATLEIRSPSGGATLLAAMGDIGGGAWDDLGRTPTAGLFAPTSQTNRSVDFAWLKPAVLARTADQAATGGYWSADGGINWRPFGASARQTRSADGGYLGAGRIAVSARGGFFLWAPDKQQALCSRDHGKTWQAVAGWPEAPQESPVPVADRSVEGVFYVHDRAGGRVLVSVDGGQSFGPAITGLPKIQSWQTSQLVCAPGLTRDLWLAFPEGLLHLPGVDKPAQLIKPVAEAWLVALGKSAPGAEAHGLYVWGRVKVGATLGEGLFRSDDAGLSFVRINDDSHRYGQLLSMTADPLEHGTLYLAPHGRGVLVGKPRQGS